MSPEKQITDRLKTEKVYYYKFQANIVIMFKAEYKRWRDKKRNFTENDINEMFNNAAQDVLNKWISNNNTQ